MTGKKKYLQPRDMLLNAICDLIELQKAKALMIDGSRGTVRLLITMYAVEREYCFAVEEIPGNRSEVTIELLSGEEDKQRLIDHEFALLDYVLIDRAKIEVAEPGNVKRSIEIR